MIGELRKRNLKQVVKVYYPTAISSFLQKVSFGMITALFDFEHQY
jgi:hypothetical protein